MDPAGGTASKSRRLEPQDALQDEHSGHVESPVQNHSENVSLSDRDSDSEKYGDTTECDPSDGKSRTREPQDDTAFVLKEVQAGAYFYPFRSGFLFFQGLKGKEVAISYGQNHMPSFAWFLNVGDIPTSSHEAKYDICITENASFSAKFRRHLQNVNASARPGKNQNQDLCTIMEIFKKMGECLQWSDSAKAWKIRDLQAEREFHDFLVGRLKTDGHSNVLVQFMLRSHLLSTFLAGMANGQGRGSMCLVLNCACLVAFGEENDDAQVHIVGSSTDPRESLPVISIKEGRVSHEYEYKLRDRSPSPGPDSSPSPPTSRTSSPSLSGLSGSWRRGSPVPVSSSHAHNRGIYADTMVFTCHGTGFPVCLFIGELKGSEEGITRNGEAQIISQLMAPLINQNIAFGMIISDREAYALVAEKVIIEENSEKKRKINVDKRRFDFCLRASGSLDDAWYRTLFNSKEFSQVFNFIVASLSYGKANIKKFI